MVELRDVVFYSYVLMERESDSRDRMRVEQFIVNALDATVASEPCC